MIVLITGASHTGKTLLAQKVLERYGFPYLSIDHLKMGLIRSGYTALTPEDDDALTEYLWPVVREIIRTAAENKQDLTVEGCYVPPAWRSDLGECCLPSVRFVCLAMTEGYIEDHYEDIVSHESEIESRLTPCCGREELKADNRKVIEGFRAAGETVTLIGEDFERTMQALTDRIMSAGRGRRMEEKTIVRCTERRQWRDWLAEHFRTEKEAWFVFPAAASGEKGVSYNDAVEEALCFGWIDGKALTLDASHHLRRFTPRRKGSAYSRPNIERLICLDREGLIHPEVRASVEKLIREPFVYPEDILDAVRRDADAWRYYQTFPEPYRRIRVAYIDAARKRPAEFAKRLNHFIARTRENKLIAGYGGIDGYYR